MSGHVGEVILLVGHLIDVFRTGAGTDIVCRPPCGLALA